MDSKGYEEDTRAFGKPRSWIKVAAFAVTFAVTGGLAAAWFYKKTLNRLHEAGQTPKNSKFGMIEERSDDESWHI